MQISSLKKVQRFSVHGIAIEAGKILLMREGKGVYKDLLNFPGGGFEFTESPEETLRREFLEEVGMRFDTCTLFGNFCSNTIKEDVEEPYHFHHVDMIYLVTGCMVAKKAEEAFEWYAIETISPASLTPIAKQAFIQLTGKNI